MTLSGMVSKKSFIECVEYAEGSYTFIAVDKHGQVFISDEDIERIANLVIKKLEEGSYLQGGGIRNQPGGRG